MKKKCTNSKCRKVFSLMDEGVSRCPYCYKMYTRIVRKKNHPVIQIKNDDYNRFGAISCLRYATGMRLDRCKEMVESKKIILGDFTPYFLYTAQNRGFDSPMKYFLHILREDGEAVIQY